MPCRRGYGLPRRFAPRNDMQKHAACQHGNDVVPGEFAALFRICLRHCSLVCAAARRTDCHVASLLAMTEGGRPCTREHLSVFSMSLRTSAHTGVAIRIPAEKPGKLVLLQANPYALFRIRPKYYFLLCPAARRTDCRVASLLAMTGKNLLRVCVCQEVLPESVLAPADTPLSSACLQCKDARPGANLRRALPSACRNWAGQPESGHGYPGDMPPGSPDYRRKAGKPYGKHRRYVETD